MPTPQSSEPDSTIGAALDEVETKALTIRMPVDVRSAALSIIAAIALIWFLRMAQEVVIPFVLSGMLFYALDPLVDQLERWRISRHIGTALALAGLALVAVVQFETMARTVAVASVALLITTLEGWVLTPSLMGRVAQMNRMAIFAGLLFWSWMWGIWGTLLAVPIMMVIKVVSDHVEELQPLGDFLGE